MEVGSAAMSSAKIHVAKSLALVTRLLPMANQRVVGDSS